MNTRRLFTAVWPSAQAVTELEDFLESSGIKAMTPELGWARPHRWHITTAFMPKVSHIQLEDLEDRLAELAAATPSLSLRLAGAGTFGKAGLHAPVWIGVDGDLEALHDLAQHCRTAASRSGIRHDSGKSFTPHVTVARRGERVDLALWLSRLDEFRSRIWTVDEFVLTESFPGTKDRPPRYEIIQRFPLGSSLPR